jgi:alanyl-tRNA synthetase
MTTNRVEQIFLEHYTRRGYHPVPGSSLLDESIPMSFVMSAGLVQVERAAAQQKLVPNSQFVLVQNCFRHFDLDLIGQDGLHLSFFRMAGAFAFGVPDRQAHIADVWHLLVNEYGLEPDRMWVTYFSGDEIDGHVFPADEQAYNAWLAAGISPERTLGLGAKSNFWKQNKHMMGEKHAAKCGPNTELFYDRGEHRSCGSDCQPGCGCGRFVEFMNMLFITWQIDETTGWAIQMDVPFVETVVGVERLAMLMQKANNIYATDSFRTLVRQARSEEQRACISIRKRVFLEHRVVDHLRAVFYLVADGAPPPHKTKKTNVEDNEMGKSSNKARGDIMRKLLRRMLTSLQLLQISRAVFLPAALELLPAAYFPQPYDPAIVRQKVLDYIADGAQKFEKAAAAARIELEHALDELPSGGKISAGEVLRIEKDNGVPVEWIDDYLSHRQVRYSHAAYRAASIDWAQKTRQSPPH